MALSVLVITVMTKGGNTGKHLYSMKRPFVSRAKPRLLWCIVVAVMAKKVKMKRMKVCPSEIRYLSAQAGGCFTPAHLFIFIDKEA